MSVIGHIEYHACTKIIIKSTTRSNFVYSTSQTVNDPKIYIGKFPKNDEKYDKNKWQDYSTKFTNAVNTPLVSLPNGSYEINITDEYGNIASYNTELKSPFLQFDTKVTTFTVADNTLLEMFSDDKMILTLLVIILARTIQVII